MYDAPRTRRSFLGTMGALVATALVRRGLTVHAGDNAWQTVGFSSREAFQKNCKETGGSFSADGLGNTSCTYKDGSWTECDANGKDCWHTPPPRTQSPADPFDVPLGGGVDDTSPTPVPATTSTPAPGNGDAADQGTADVTTHKRHGKRRKRGRKAK